MAAGEKNPAPYEQKREDFWFKNFLGVNTQADRTAIADEEFAWLENLMPVGYANLRVVPHQGSSFATMPAGTISYWKYVNINNADYVICVSAFGGAYQIAVATGVATLIAAPFTFNGTVAVAQWKNERVLIVASGGYWSWDGTTLTSLAGVTSAPASGSTIGTFAGRVWVGDGRTVTFSAPNSYTDFQVVSSGGSFILSDETFKSGIKHIAVGNNFLYVYGDSAIQAISDVRVSAGITLFSNVNLTATFGTTSPMSVYPFYRAMAFSTSIGFHNLTGSTPVKISDALDGAFPNIVSTSPISGGVANIYNQLCEAFLFQYLENGITRGLLALRVNKKWFFAAQGDFLTLICAGFQSGVPVLFGTDGTSLYKLFSNTANSVNWSLKTALWMLKDPIATKQVFQTGVEVTTATVPAAIDVTVVTDVGAALVDLTASNQGDWIDDAGTGMIGKWVNAAAVEGSWEYAGFSIFQGDAQAGGRYIGMDISGSIRGAKINGLLIDVERQMRWAARST